MESASLTRAGRLVAAVAEVEVDKSSGEVAVKRIVVAHDCGLIVNPDGLRNQIDGNVIQAVSRTLLEEVQYDSSSVKSLDWNSYPVLTFKNVPDIEIVLINRPEMEPFAGGEPSIIPVPAAIGNAVFDATGVRLREVPLTPQRVLKALQAGASGVHRG
jgi:CO/xanthine dehydrogenase Mo-binding subunit